MTKQKIAENQIRIVDWESGEELDVLITSEEATKTIILHDLDVEFIEEDYNSSGVKNGELEVIVDEGLITINWELI